LAMTIFYVVKVPIRVCFDAIPDPWETTFDMFADICFLCDILLNFRIGYEEKLTMILITSPRLVALHCKFGFSLEWLSCG